MLPIHFGKYSHTITVPDTFGEILHALIAEVQSRSDMGGLVKCLMRRHPSRHVAAGSTESGR